MKGFLNNEQIGYVLYHLGHHIQLSEAIRESFVFVEQKSEIEGLSNKIIFRLSRKPFSIPEITWESEVPVLFPVAGNDNIVSFENGNLIFNHDILKSAFYLLSGYQEKENEPLDSIGRYAYEASVQAKLNIIQKPVVNYYFEIIINAIEKFCQEQKTEFKRIKTFQNFALFLTHDVDRIKYYNLNSLLFAGKQLLGLSRSEKTIVLQIKEICKIGFNILNIFKRSDPYWNFEFLSEQEKNLGIRSTYFFLPKDQRHVDSYYNLRERKIKKLMQFLLSEGHEIALHGTVRSHYSGEALSNILNEFFSVTGLNQTGIRQHRLMWKHPDTAIYHDSRGILYDSTLGFAAHEGFRNSYCHPFRLFDFSKNRMLNTWEIPLNLMDSTIFYYRKLRIDTAKQAVEKILNEIIHFNGIFTILWHNSYFNEDEVPGVTRFYHDILTQITDKNPEVLTGSEIINRL